MNSWDSLGGVVIGWVEGARWRGKGERIVRAGIIVYGKEEGPLGGGGPGRRAYIDIEIEPKETYICVKFPLLSLQKVFNS